MGTAFCYFSLSWVLYKGNNKVRVSGKSLKELGAGETEEGATRTTEQRGQERQMQVTNFT